MSKIDKLHGVAHDIAHHAQSAFGWLHPHLGEACRDAGVLTAKVDLLSEEPYPTGFPKREPLALALGALHQALENILQKHGFELSDLEAADIEFEFPPGYVDCSRYRAHSTLVAHGRKFEKSLAMIGECKSGHL